MSVCKAMAGDGGGGERTEFGRLMGRLRSAAETHDAAGMEEAARELRAYQDRTGTRGRAMPLYDRPGAAPARGSAPGRGSLLADIRRLRMDVADLANQAREVSRQGRPGANAAAARQRAELDALLATPLRAPAVTVPNDDDFWEEDPFCYFTDD